MDKNKDLKCVNSIFEQPWYLEAASNGNWDAIELSKGNEVYARWTYSKLTRMGFEILSLPPLVQTGGVYIKDTGAKLTKKLEREKKVINELIDSIPTNVNVDLRIDSNCDYLLPYIWRGFKLHPCVSYRLKNLEDLDLIWKGFKENIKTDIKKATKRVHIVDDMDIEVLLDIRNKTFKRQDRTAPDHDAIIRRIDKALVEHNARKFLCAVDDDGNVHAIGYFIFDEKRCYYLIGGGDPEYRNSGAGSLVVWEGIKYASTVTKEFDFEGSMVEDIERFFRGFGAEPSVYYRLTRFNSLLSFMDFIKPKIKKILKYK